MSDMSTPNPADASLAAAVGEPVSIGPRPSEPIDRSTEHGPLAGARTLLYKEVLRFWKVSFQTVAAPVLTAVLYLLIFGHVLEGRVTVFGSVGYTSFLIPGLVMMSVCRTPSPIPARR